MRKILILSVVILFVFLISGCNENKTDFVKYEDQSLYSDDDTISIILSNNNYLVLELEDGTVGKTSYVYHYSTEEDAEQMCEVMSKDLDEKYTDVKCDGCFLYLEYSSSNPDSLNGLTVKQVELLYGDNIVR